MEYRYNGNTNLSRKWSSNAWSWTNFEKTVFV